MMLSSCGSAVMKRSGLNTQPCGAPVFSLIVLEVELPIQTDCSLPVRKSSTQLQRELLSPSWLSLTVRCCGMTVVKAELKSMISILT